MGTRIPSELVEAVRRQRIVPFVGAGVSQSVKPGLFPSWKDLLEALAQELDEQQLAEVGSQVRRHIATGDFLDAAEVAVQPLGAFRFNRFLRRRFRRDCPDDADLSVVRALWDLRPSLVLTTNYDDVLVWGHRRAEQIANDQDDELMLMDAEEAPDAPRVWHLHGTIHRLSTIVLGGSDYRRLYGGLPEAGSGAPQGEIERQHQTYSTYAAALSRLRDRLAGRPFLYLGFSLNDQYVLRQIQHVLQMTKGKGAPSYALMKQGEGHGPSLWSNYNIQLVEYEDHGAPLAELLAALRRAAFGEGSRAANVPLTKPEELPHVPRTALVEEYAGILRRQRRLVLLAPKRGGARSLTRQIAERYGARVSWLAPPSHPDATEAEYCRILAGGDDGVRDFVGLVEHLRRRAEGMGGEHLVVLRYEWGSLEHLKKLGAHLRRLQDESTAAPFHVLVAGGIRSAWLIHHVQEYSAFQDAPRREIPDFTVEEVRQFLEAAGHEGRWAAEVHAATGGYLGLLNESMLGGGPQSAEAMTRRLVQSPTLRDTVRERLRDEERNARSGERHARWVLQELLAGREVQRLENLDHQEEYAEVRLYFDGLVRRDEAGKTVLRCPAVARVVAEALARQDVRP